jgi:hypothetical protein
MNVHDKFEAMWKGEVVAYFKVLFQNMSGGTRENHETRVIISGLGAENLNRGIRKMKQECLSVTSDGSDVQ